MRISALLLAALFLFASPAHAAETSSLFFTPAEIQKIETPGAPAVEPPADIHLGAVLYYKHDNWSIWLDGIRWTPQTRRADLQIIEVRPDRVTLQLLHETSQPITLRPHQTWQASSKKIIEGIQ